MDAEQKQPEASPDRTTILCATLSGAHCDPLRITIRAHELPKDTLWGGVATFAQHCGVVGGDEKANAPNRQPPHSWSTRASIPYPSVCTGLTGGISLRLSVGDAVKAAEALQEASHTMI